MMYNNPKAMSLKLLTSTNKCGILNSTDLLPTTAFKYSAQVLLLVYYCTSVTY